MNEKYQLLLKYIPLNLNIYENRYDFIKELAQYSIEPFPTIKRLTSFFNKISFSTILPSFIDNNLDLSIYQYTDKEGRILFTKDTCWGWIGHINKAKGYGKFAIVGTNPQHASRIMLELFTGETPKDLQARHHCDHPECTNPFHLQFGTNFDDHEDKILRNKNTIGERHGMSILSEKDVIEILVLRKYLNYGQTQLAKLFNISKGAISGIIYEVNWAHLDISTLSQEQINLILEKYSN